MLAVLRAHGAAMVERRGRLVPADFGSVAAEAAVCRTRVGLVERSDRAMLEVRGDGPDVDRALAELAPLGDHAWWLRRSARRVIVRCEAADEDACISALRRAEEVAVVDIALGHAVIDLVGPLADAVLDAWDRDRDGDVLVVRKDGACVELIVSQGDGPALWYQLLEAGEPFQVACVGIDATEHLAVSAHRSAPRRP